MNTIVYYLQEVLEQLIEKALSFKEGSQGAFEEGTLWGYYFTLSELLSVATNFGLINYLPKSLQGFDPESLIKNISKGHMPPTKRIRDTVKASQEGTHKDSYLRVVLEQLITDAIDLREGGKVKNDFDDGKSFAYYCTILTLLNQAEGFGLSDDLPAVLQDFVPEHLGHIKKSDLGF
jgi:hypothetical protein